MTRLFRSKSCGLIGIAEFARAPPSPIPSDEDGRTSDEEEESFEGDDSKSHRFATTPFISPHSGGGGSGGDNRHQFAIVDVLVAALRKSLVTCSVEREKISSLDISYPTEVRHVSHVTFDRFHGFLGLPRELQPEVPRKAPSASVSVFGVSPKSMQCAYDERGNSVPVILLKMQKRLYAEGGLKAEGIFRINAENGKEEYVRTQLNRGVVPLGIDVHCLAGLIKAWFRELPAGVLDSLTPEQVMHCNTEDDCTQLVKLLPPTEAALLDWAINLMADVACHEEYNKMNARNIAMVFAPNMTQMADPLTALIHAVQVMNFLKTLILRTLRERGELDEHTSYDPFVTNANHSQSSDKTSEPPCIAQKFTKTEVEITALAGPETHTLDEAWNDQNKNEEEEEYNSGSGSSSSSSCKREAAETRSRGEYEAGDWLSLRKGVRRLCRHPVFQFGKPAKKTRGLEIVNS